MQLSVAMITMNEEGAIAKVVADIRAVVPDAEILIVDSSQDRTPEIAESLGVKVIRQFPPRGYGNAMDMALRSCSGEVVVTLDCDDTYPTEAIPQLVALVESGGYDLVDGSRLQRGRPGAMPLSNYLANRLFALVASVLHGLPATDLHSGMRAYRKSMLDRMNWDPSGPALPVELLLLPHRLGFRVTQVGIDYRERIGQTTLNKWESTKWTFKRMVRMARVKPLARPQVGDA